MIKQEKLREVILTATGGLRKEKKEVDGHVTEVYTKGRTAEDETKDKRIKIGEAEANNLVIMGNANIILDQGLDDREFAKVILQPICSVTKLMC